MIIALHIVGGLVLLIWGGEVLVRSAVTMAERLRLSPLLIGLTVVAMGGSMPELMTTVEAALIGSPGIAIGNVIGSNIANSLLILGAAAFVLPFAAGGCEIRRDGGTMLTLSVILTAFVFYGYIGRIMGVLLLISLAGYIMLAYWQDAKNNRVEEDSSEPSGPFPWMNLFLLVAGLALLIFGAKFLVDGAIDLARLWEVSETVIGLTLIAIGTSLPELATSVIAALKRQGDLVIGNVIGSNIYNIAGILGVTTIISPIKVPTNLNTQDILILLGSAVLVIVFVITGRRISRLEGAILLAGYAGFIALLALRH